MSADLALAADPSVVERAADPGEFIIQSCERAKTWLREALEHGDIDSIAECKSQAEAIRVYTMSKQLGKDAQLSATEIVRRAERGIGVAIRRGQSRVTHQPGNTGLVSSMERSTRWTIPTAEHAGHLNGVTGRPAPTHPIVPESD